jgi:hypothetical protein
MRSPSFVAAAVLSFSLGICSAAGVVAPAFSWAKTWGGSQNEFVYRMALDGAGNIYVTGQFGGSADFNPDPSVTEAHTSNGGQDVFLSKFSSTGVLQWARTWGGSGRDVANGIAVDGAGNVYVAGPFQYTVDFDPDPLTTDTHISNNSSGANNTFVSKFDSSGSFKWARTWGPSVAGGEAYSVAVDSSNNVYVVGDFESTTSSLVDFNPWGAHDYHASHGFFDAFLSKIDSNGTFVWAKTWGGEGYDDGPAVAVDASGNVYVAGMYASFNIDFDPAGGGAVFPAHDSGYVVDVFLSKFASDGTFRWVRTWGGQGADDVGGGVLIDRSSDVYVWGRYGSSNCDFNPWGIADIHSSNGSVDAYVSKFDSSGTFQWARTWGSTGWDAAIGLVADGSNNVCITGVFAGTVDFDPSAGGTDIRTSNGLQDAYITMLNSGGSFGWARTWGGTGDDGAFDAAIRRTAGTLHVAGHFSSAADLDPGTGIDNHTSNGQADASLSTFVIPPTAVMPDIWTILE